MEMILVLRAALAIILTTLSFPFSRVQANEQGTKTPTSYPFLYASKWNDYILLGNGESVSSAVNYNAGKPLLVPIESDPTETTLDVAGDFTGTALARIVKREDKIFLKIKDKSYADQEVNIPPELVTNNPRDRWLYLMNGQIYLFRRDGRVFTYGTYHNKNWDIKTIKPPIKSPGWFSRNYQKYIVLNRDGVYCINYSGEWGAGVLFCDFKQKQWQEVYGFNVDTQRPFICPPTGLRDGLWIITNSEIRKVIQGKTINVFKTSDFPGADLSDLTSANADSCNNLYFVSKEGFISKLSDPSLNMKSKTHEVSSVYKLARGPSDLCLMYAESKFLLLALSYQNLVLLDLKTDKFVEPNLVEEKLKL